MLGGAGIGAAWELALASIMCVQAVQGHGSWVPHTCLVVVQAGV